MDGYTGTSQIRRNEVLKDEYKKKLFKEKPPRKEFKTIGIVVSLEEHTAFLRAANECKCTIAEYIRRLHRLAQEK